MIEEKKQDKNNKEEDNLIQESSSKSKEVSSKRHSLVDETATEGTPAEEVVAEEATVETAVEEEKTSAEEIVAEEAAIESVAKEDVPNEKNVTTEEVTMDETSNVENKEENINENSDKISPENSSNIPFMIGTKVGMTQIFSDNGDVYPVTIIQAGPCNITQIKTDKTDGYNAIQIGYLNKKKRKSKKSDIGHFNKSKLEPKKYLREFRCKETDSLQLGLEININQFNVGDFLNITGTSKGKGFAGHMKRHNFSGGRASHGKNSVMRKAGSVGAGTSPGRIWKGTRMAGRMGNDKVTIKNLELIKLDCDKNLLFINGSIPGANKNIVYISRTNYES